MSEEISTDDFENVGDADRDTENWITGFGTFPAEWDKKDIVECAEIRDSERIPLNSQEREKLKPGSIPYYGANGVLEYIDDHIFDSELILLAEDGGHFEEYQKRPIAYRISGKSWVNNHAHILEASKGTVHDYLFYSLEHRNLVPYVSGSTRSKLTQSMLKRVKIPSPPVSEQRKIAAVLNTVDQAIEKTDTIVSRLERLQKGLFHNLIPGGIDHDQYNDVRILGRTVQIPTSWDLTTVSEACSDIIDYRGKNPEFSEGGIPHLRNINIGRGELLLDDLKYVSEETYEEWMTRGIPREGDTLLSTEAPMGKTAVLPEMKFSLSQRLIVLRPGKQFNNRYFAHLMGSPFVQKEYEARATGSTVKGISNYNLQEVTIPVPPRNEQEMIADVIDEIFDTIQANEQEVDRLKRLKYGLLQDLLSGSVRTTDRDIEVPEAIAQYG